jgi:hypothetical protein
LIFKRYSVVYFQIVSDTKYNSECSQSKTNHSKGWFTRGLDTRP